MLENSLMHHIEHPKLQVTSDQAPTVTRGASCSLVEGHTQSF